MKAFFVDAMVAQVLGTGHIFYMKNLQVEAEMFGDVDLIRETCRRIAIPKTAFSMMGSRLGPRDHTLGDVLRNNVRAFCRANSIKLVEYDPGHPGGPYVLNTDMTKPAFKTAIQQAL